MFRTLNELKPPNIVVVDKPLETPPRNDISYIDQTTSTGPTVLTILYSTIACPTNHRACI